MRKHDKNKTNKTRIYLFSNAYTYLSNLYIYIILYHMCYIVIYFVYQKLALTEK